MIRRRAADGTADEGETDRGATLVEILVAVVLLGVAGVATLGALQTTIIGTRLERDHAKAHQWLQSAIGVLQAADRVDCDEGEVVMRTNYQDHIRLNVINPEGWSDSQLTILEPVKVWDGEQYWDPAAAAADPAINRECFDDEGYKLQLVTIQVTSPDGDILETVQVVKDD